MFGQSLALNSIRRGIFGTLVEGALGGFPTKPKVPQAPNVDPALSQQNSIAGNQAALPALETLGSGVDSYNLAQRAKALNAGIPGYSDITSAGSKALESELAGQLPSDVVSQVQRNANAKAYSGGYAGSPMGDNLTARDLGLTSLNLIQHGQQLAPGWLQSMASLAVPPQFNVQSGFMSPEQRLSADWENANAKYSNQWTKNVLDSIPDPETAAIAKDVGGITDLVATAALTWAGGAIGMEAGGAAGGMLGSQLGGQIAGGSSGGAAPGMDIGSQLQQILGSFGGGGAGGGGGGQFQTSPGPYGSSSYLPMTPYSSPTSGYDYNPQLPDYFSSGANLGMFA